MAPTEAEAPLVAGEVAEHVGSDHTNVLYVRTELKPPVIIVLDEED
jgi:hypothetical protein